MNYSRNPDGKYAHSKDFQSMCACGHVLGVHAGDNDTKLRPCFNEDTGMNDPIRWPEIVATGEHCDCPNFRKRKATKEDR